MQRKIGMACLIVTFVLASTSLGQIIPGDAGSYPSVQVTNSPHNLNNYPGVTLPGNQVCLPCHTPHNALKEGPENVLWNHAETGETFTMYYSEARQDADGTTRAVATEPTGRSKMCLSCHDGVTAIDNYGGNGGTGIVITGSAALGSDLQNDHPIGVEYPTNKPAEYRDPATYAPGIGGRPGVTLATVDGTDRVECTSCHDAHNNGLGKFLRVPLQESYLCLQCHIK